MKAVTKQEQGSEVQQPVEAEAFIVPAAIMNAIFTYITRAPWIEVNEFINQIRTSITPVPFKKTSNETKDKTTSSK